MRTLGWLALTFRIAAAAFAVLFAMDTAPGGIDSAVAIVRAQDQAQLPDVLTKSRALYGTLTSYADAGMVTVEAPGLVDTAKFKTYFRRPTDFFFDYYDHTSVSAGLKIPMPTRHVLWMFKGELEAWEGAGKTHSIYPRAEGRQVSALTGLAAGTHGAVVLISSLLFTQANIKATLQETVQASVAGEEIVDKRRCHKIVGVAQSVYPSGAVSNVRPVTIWIDAESLLIRKVFEDTPKGYPAGSFSRTTITYQPQANPTLTDAQFAFKVPSP